MPITLFDRLVSAFDGAIAEANIIEVDRTNLDSVQGDNSQDIADDLEQLYGVVRSIQQHVLTVDKQFEAFTDSVTINASNINDFINKVAIYTASSDQRINFLLPLDSVITTYPFEVEVQNFGGTKRYDTGATPNNTIIVDTQDTTEIRRDSTTGALLTNVPLHKGDIGIFTKASAGEPWVVEEGSLELRTSLLPSGIFSVNERTIEFTTVGGIVGITGLNSYVPQQGDAFEVTGDGITALQSFGVAINTGDVMVALVNNPNLTLTTSNTDWLVIRNAGQGILTLKEIRFLSQVVETDTPNDIRMESDGATNAVVWLTPAALTTAPFLQPSTDPNNPRTPETIAYIGGNEDRDSNGDFTYGTGTSYEGLLYVGITPSYINDNSLSDLYVQFFDIDGNKIEEYNLNDVFVKASFADDSTFAFFVYSAQKISNTYTDVRYNANTIIRLVHRTQNRSFGFSSAVDCTNRVSDLQESQLSQIVQAKLNRETSLDTEDRERLDSIEVAEETGTIPTDLDYKFKFNGISHVFSDYLDVSNSDGLIGNIAAQPIAFLVPDSVTVSGLTWSRGTIDVTEVTPSVFDNYKTYTATIPAFNGGTLQSPLDFPITLAGSQETTTATGLDVDIKVDGDNLNATLSNLIFNALQELPTVLRRFIANATVNNTTGTDYEPTNDIFPKRTAFVFFKKEPVDGTSPVTTDDIVNEIVASEVTVNTYPAVANVYVPATDGTGGLSDVTNGYVHERGIYNSSMVLNLPDANNPILLLGFSYAFTRFVTGETPLLQIKEHGSTNYRTIISSDQDRLYFFKGNEDSTGGVPRVIRHDIQYVGGGIAYNFIVGDTLALWRIGMGATYQLFWTLFEDDIEFGTGSNSYSIPDIDTRQPLTVGTFTITNADETDTREITITTRFEFHYSFLYDDIFEVGVRDLQANQRLRLEVYTTTAANPSGSDLTFNRITFQNFSSIRYVPQSIIMSFRPTNQGNLAMAVYFSNGPSQIVDLKYPWADLDFSVIRIGAPTQYNRMVFYNFQGGKYAANTQDDHLPNEIELRDMLIHHDNLDEDYIYGLFQSPSNNVETIQIDENTLFNNLILRSQDRGLYRLTIENDGSLRTTLI